MKYILKKDLPFAKAGSEVTKEKLYVPNDPRECYLVDTYWGQRYVIGFVHDILTESFIEEVKPREWWVRILDENHIEITKNEIELAGWSFDRLSKIIKVREVIQ